MDQVPQRTFLIFAIVLRNTMQRSTMITNKFEITCSASAFCTNLNTVNKDHGAIVKLIHQVRPETFPITLRSHFKTKARGTESEAEHLSQRKRERVGLPWPMQEQGWEPKLAKHKRGTELSSQKRVEPVQSSPLKLESR